jgi:hypothetical protein
MRILLLAGCLAATACSSSSTNDSQAAGGTGGTSGASSGGTGNASTGGSSGGGAAGVGALPACDLQKPFGAPEKVPNVNSAAMDGQARISSDGLTLYFGSSRLDGIDMDLYRATRLKPSDDFSEAARVPVVSTAGAAGNEDAPFLSDNGLELFFSRGVTFEENIFLATRTKTALDFDVGTPVSGINDPAYSDGTPFISAEGTELFFTSNRVGNDWRVFRADRLANGSFTEPEEVAELNTPDSVQDMCPVLDPDGRTLYFASTRNVTDDHDIWMATRTGAGQPFEDLQVLTALVSNQWERPTSISRDGCTLYFERGGTGTFDIWQATRPK